MSAESAQKFSDDFLNQYDKAGSNPASAAYLVYMLRYIQNWKSSLADAAKQDMVMKRLNQWAYKGTPDDCVKFQNKWTELGGLTTPLPSDINSQAKNLLAIIAQQASARKAELEQSEAAKKQAEIIAKAKAEGEAAGKSEAEKAAAEKKKLEYELAQAQYDKAKLANDNPSGKKVRTTESVSIRSEPKVDSKNVLSKAKSGEILEVSTKNTGGEWTRVMHKGGGAWVATKYLKDVVETVTPKGTVKVKTTKPTSTKTSYTPSQQVESTPVEEEGVSTGAKVGIGIGALVVIGGIIFFATRGK